MCPLAVDFCCCFLKFSTTLFSILSAFVSKSGPICRNRHPEVVDEDDWAAELRSFEFFTGRARFTPPGDKIFCVMLFCPV